MNLNFSRYVLAAIIMFIPTLVLAFPGDMRQLPNSTVLGCQICHNSQRGGSVNSFGREAGTGRVNWASVCPSDSDGDSFTNGEELQDPDCEWSTGDPAPGNSSLVTSPGNSSDFPETISSRPMSCSCCSNI